MQFKFEANQQYQLDAIAAVADLFEGQGKPDGPDFLVLEGTAINGNRLDLDDATLLANLQAVQTRAGLVPDSELKLIKGEIEVPNGTNKKTKVKTAFPNFSIEMETGTGKTYVYLRAALELHSRYGMRKFIVVVPSVAVREGVLATLRQTTKHFAKEFGNTPYKFSVYRGDKPGEVAGFARDEHLQFLVMTIDSFSKTDLNVIYRDANDKVGGNTPIHLIQAARPILILDEPQNMESEKRVAALAALNPLFALRFSATHRNSYNLVHRLTPYDAYRLELVKHIEVASVLQDNDYNHAFVRVESLASSKNTITSRITVHQLMRDGTIKEKTHTCKWGDKLRDKADRPDYAGYIIEEINLTGQFVRFENGLEVRTGVAHGIARDQIFEAQIRYTVGEHLRKQERLRAKGIKVLSLFFIDRVANYRAEDGGEGKIAEMFARAFDEIKVQPKFAAHWAHQSAGDVQAAYFAAKKKGGEEIFEDSTNGKAKKDEVAYDLIMRSKEKLLSMDEPTAFLFSHSALREGWDNPNVFQICTLNQTVSDMKKRQEVGRGVRLARDADGELVRDKTLNILTVIANQSYQAYVETLQSEITDEYGEGAPKVPITKATRDKATATLDKARLLDPEFADLWERIKRKTRYSVHVDTARLVEEVVDALNKIKISAPSIVAAKATVSVPDFSDELKVLEAGSARVANLSQGTPSTDLIGTMLHLLEFTTPRMCLSRQTLFKILTQMDETEAALANPQEFALKAVEIIKSKLAGQLIGGIKYEETGEFYDQTILDETIESNADKMIDSPKGLYDRLVFDSQVERKFVEEMETYNWVKRYIKLPRLFLVPTPIGNYNPDWAIVAARTDEFGDEETPLLNLIRETKSSLKADDLRIAEERKIKCGKAHFEGALGVDFKKIIEASQILPDE